MESVAFTKAVKQRWIKALRSGEYKQGKGQLRRVRNGQESFCCLGVLCDLELDGEWTGGRLRLSDGTLIKATDEMILDDVFGFDSYSRGKLVLMNDGRWGYEPRSFEEIADHIETHVRACDE